MSNSNISDEELLQKFVNGGFGQTSNQLDQLRDYLDNRAAETGLAAPMYLCEAISKVAELFRKHDVYGGLRVGFLNQLDNLVRNSVPEIQRGDPLQSARRARELRDEVVARVRNYDPRETYE